MTLTDERQLPAAERPGHRCGLDHGVAMIIVAGGDGTVRAVAEAMRELDGDEFGEAVGFRTWVEPGALTVRVPARIQHNP